MKMILPTKYNIINDDHLFDIINKGYSMELGTISLDTSEALLNGEEISLKKLVSPLITSNGIGLINNKNNPLEINLQFNFLKQQLNQLSSNILTISYGTITYYLEDKEHVAPIIVYPLQYNAKNNTVQILEQSFLNSPLLELLVKNRIIFDSERRKIEKRFQSINNISDIDELLIRINTLDNVRVGTVNYLTTFKIEYQEEYFNPDRFSKIKGLGENHISVFLKNYLKANPYQVTPLNIEQKYALLRAHNGETLCIDGPVATGKTETAINIIMDAVASHKRILYVNQSKDQINAFKKRMADLGLADYIYDGCTNLENYPNMELNAKPKKNKSTFVFNNVELFGKKYMGYRYSDILNSLIELKTKGIKETYDIEPGALDRQEIEDICKILNQMEKYLLTVKPLNDNIWNNVKTLYDTAKPKDLKAYIDILYKRTEDFVNKLTSFAQDNYLKPIGSLTEYLHLNEIIKHLIEFRPLNSWFDKDFYEDAYAAIKEIDSFKQSYEEIKLYYFDNINKDYSYGDMKQIYDNLQVSNLRLVDKILGNEVKVEELAKQITKTVKEIFNSNVVFKKYFTKSDLNTDAQFYNLLYHYLINGYINNLWAKAYLSNPVEYYQHHSKFIKVYEEYLLNKKEFCTFINNYDINYNDFITINHNDKNQVLRLFTTKYNLNKNNYDLDRLYYKYLSFINYGVLVNQAYPYLISSAVSFDLEWNNYYRFLNFIDELTIDKTNHNQQLFMNYLNNFDIIENPQASELYVELRSFEYNFRFIDSFIQKMNYFDIDINTNTFIDSLNSLLDKVDTLIKYAKFKEKTYSYFKEKDMLTVDNIFYLINKDDEFIKLNRTMEESKDKYIHLFGDQAYQKERTNTILLLKEISNFRMYQSMLNQNFNNDLVNEDFFLNLINDNIRVNSFYYKWNASFREAFSCFKYADFTFQKLSFEKMLENLAKYQENYADLDNTYEVIACGEKIKNYGISKFVKQIYDSIITTNLADKFLYSILTKYYDYLTNNGADFSDRLLHQECDNNYELEVNTCLKTRINLAKNYKRYAVKKITPRIKRSSTNNQALKTIYSCPVSKYITVVDTFTLNNIFEGMSLYNLIVIDDAHISNINKYGNLNINNQIIVLGDRDANLSAHNGLLNRISKDHMIHFNKRYYDFNEDLCNPITNKNIYLYNPRHKTEIINLDSINNLGEIIMNHYLKHHQPITIKTTTLDLQVSIYKSIINAYYYINNQNNTNNQKNDIDTLNSFIRIEDVNDNLGFVNEITYLVAPYLQQSDLAVQERIFRNLNTQELYICNLSVKNIRSIFDTYKLLGKHLSRSFYLGTIEYYLSQEITKSGIKIIGGKGIVNMLIPTTNKMIGICIVDDKVIKSYYYNDDLTYTKVMFNNLDWCLLTFSLCDIYQDINQVIDQIIEKYGELNGN